MTDECKATCLHCRAEYSPNKKGQKFCSTTCRVKNWHMKTAGMAVVPSILGRLDDIEKRLKAGGL